jgi:hypothetical protein
MHGRGKWAALGGGLLFCWAAQAQTILTNYQDGTQNIVFVGPDQHIYQIVATGSTWVSADVTAAAGLPVAATGTALSSFVDGNAIGISFFGSNQHAYEAVYVAGQGWSGVDVTAAANLPAAAVGSALTTYLDGDQNWVYQGASQHIYEAVFNGAWSGFDVTAASGLPTAASGTAISSFVDGNAIGISFFGSNQHAYEAFYLGQGWVEWM